MNRTPLAAGLLGVLLLAACDAGPSDPRAATSTVKAELRRVEVAAAASMSLASQDSGGGVNPTNRSQTSGSVRISSFRVPIREIWLRSVPDSAGVRIYRCADASKDGCLVDLSTGALRDLLAAREVEVPSDVYRFIRIVSCYDEGWSYPAYLTATATVGGRTYYTRAAGGMEVTGPAEPVQLGYNGCSRIYALPQEFRVAEGGAAQVLRLYYELAEIAFAGVGQPSGVWNTDGCSSSRVQGPAGPGFICAAAPDIAGTAAAAPPRVERYRISDHATLILYFSAEDDRPIGGYTRRFFVEGVANAPPFTPGAAVEAFVRNDDGSYRIMGFPPRVRNRAQYLFTSFRREGHESGLYDHEGSWRTYRAVRLPG